MSLNFADLCRGGSPLARSVVDIALAGAVGACFAQPALLLVLTGGSGAGKSTVRDLITQQLPFVSLRNDQLRRACIKRPTLAPDEDRLFFDALDEAALMLLSAGMSVIWDARFPTRELRNRKRALVQSQGFGFCCIHVNLPRALRTPRRLCRKCQVRVGINVDYYYDDALRALRAQNTTPYEEPRDDEDVIRFDNLLPPNSDDIATLITAIKHKMRRDGVCFLPDLEVR